MIVIFSAKSSTTDLHEPNNAVKIVYEALTKYDTPTCHEKVFVLEGGLYEWSRQGWHFEFKFCFFNFPSRPIYSLYTHLTSNPQRPQAKFTASTIIESAKNADYTQAQSILTPKVAPKPKPTPKPVEKAPPTPPTPEIKPDKTSELDDELARKQAKIDALNRERAELELANAKKKKENEELARINNRQGGFEKTILCLL